MYLASHRLQYGQRLRTQALSQLPIACSTVKGFVPRPSLSFPSLAVRSKASYPGPLSASHRLQYGQRLRTQALSQLPIACSTVKGFVPRPSLSFPLLAVRSKASYPGPLSASHRLQYGQRLRTQALSQLPIACSTLNRTASDGKLREGLGTRLVCTVKIILKICSHWR